jgi:two-component system, cell cycle sensor histidine kinase and response regulator CckA
MAVRGIDSGAHGLALLARAGELLASPGAGDHTLERLAGLLVPSLASWCAIDVLTDDGSVERVASAPDSGRGLRHDGPHGPAVVMRTGEPELVAPVTEEFLAGAGLRDMASRSYLCVPLMAHDRPFGAITLLASDRVYGPAEIDLAGELARRAATAIENGRLIDRLARS